MGEGPAWGGLEERVVIAMYSRQFDFVLTSPSAS